MYIFFFLHLYLKARVKQAVADGLSWMKNELGVRSCLLVHETVGALQAAQDRLDVALTSTDTNILESTARLAGMRAEGAQLWSAPGHVAQQIQQLLERQRLEERDMEILTHKRANLVAQRAAVAERLQQMLADAGAMHAPSIIIGYRSLSFSFLLYFCSLVFFIYFFFVVLFCCSFLLLFFVVLFCCSFLLLFFAAFVAFVAFVAFFLRLFFIFFIRHDF